MICLSTNSQIPLKQFIGCQTAVDIVTDKSELTRVSGIVAQADIGASDGSLTIYRLTVKDSTALWNHRRNSRVIYAELSGDFPLGDSRQPTYKSLRPFDLVS